jgi:predicted CXXCH cytochrome family protein
MKTSITSIAKLAGGLALMAASSAALASVSNTPHNLSSSGTGAHMSGTTVTTEICIFCHTPHGGDQSVAAPIWNRTVSSTSVYTRFSTMNRITFDADEAPIGSVSIACLSCHDGTQARDAVINGPGSGPNNNWSATDGAAGSWVDGTNAGSAYLSALKASDNGSTSGDLIYLGTDLRNDHPISMQYAGGGIDSNATAGATRDPDFAQAVVGQGSYGLTAANNSGSSSSNFGVTGVGTGAVKYTTQGGGPKWYVDTGTAGYQGTDFPLYTRIDGPNSTVAQPYVECATCHDPHSNNTTFLRLPGGNTGSQVCLTCHAK